MKNSIVIIFFILSAIFITACGNEAQNLLGGDSEDTADTADGDTDLQDNGEEDSETQSEDGDSPDTPVCTPQVWECFDDRTAVLCDEYGAGYIETVLCEDGEVCYHGECMGDENPDSDNYPDGDYLPDGDDTPDGDDYPDGDYLPDGDDVPDGDNIPDGDDAPDGDDIQIDGDEDEDLDTVEYDYDADNGAFSSCNGLTNTALRNCLHNLIDDHTSLGYDGAREVMYDELDNQDGEVCCVYIGICVDMKYTINAEHTWPQSYGADTGSAKSDLHHLFPTESTANSIRSNLRFGDVVGTPDWQQGGSKKGDDQYGSTVFEVRDDHKGDTARAVFYMAVRYNGINDDNFLTETMESVLREWHWEDPPDEYEIERNDNIDRLYQHNRNPFVDRPDFADQLEDFSD